jgi:hypothetical protein
MNCLTRLRLRYTLSREMTFRPDTFRDLANWILVAIGLLLPHLLRAIRDVTKTLQTRSARPPATIYDTGSVTAGVEATGREAISDGGTVYLRLTPSSTEAIAA